MLQEPLICFAQMVSTQIHIPIVVTFNEDCYMYKSDRGFSFERNCLLRRWKSETLQ